MDFVACLTVPGNEDLVKMEVAERGLPWALSFSRPGLVTFKVNGPLVCPSLAFALAVAPVLEKVSALPEGRPDNDGKDYLEFGKQWLVVKGLKLIKAVPAPEHSPSRAYGKIAEIISLYPEHFHPPHQVLELGCAPGGASLCLLEKGLKVTGIDPAEMDYSITHHSGFRHWNMPVQILKEKLMARTDRFELLVSDLNLNARDNLRWAMDIAKWLSPSLKFSAITVKANGPLDVKTIVKFLNDHGDRYHAKQVPSHRRETCVVGKA